MSHPLTFNVERSAQGASPMATERPLRGITELLEQYRAIRVTHTLHLTPHGQLLLNQVLGLHYLLLVYGTEEELKAAVIRLAAWLPDPLYSLEAVYRMQHRLAIDISGEVGQELRAYLAGCGLEFWLLKLDPRRPRVLWRAGRDPERAYLTRQNGRARILRDAQFWNCYLDRDGRIEERVPYVYLKPQEQGRVPVGHTCPNCGTECGHYHEPFCLIEVCPFDGRGINDGETCYHLRDALAAVDRVPAGTEIATTATYTQREQDGYGVLNRFLYRPPGGKRPLELWQVLLFEQCADSRLVMIQLGTQGYALQERVYRSSVWAVAALEAMGYVRLDQAGKR